jgi:uncharacterized damage-inducible protein DinB
MTSATCIHPFQIGRAALEVARTTTIAYCEDIPDDQFLHRPAAGCNHAAWILGHLAYADSMICAGISGGAHSAPRGFKPLFGIGSTPGDDASVYPSPAELRTVLQTTRQALLAWFQGMDDVQLASPLPNDWEGFAPSYASLMTKCAWHEGVHSGQLTVIRKTLGLPSKFF